MKATRTTLEPTYSRNGPPLGAAIQRKRRRYLNIGVKATQDAESQGYPLASAEGRSQVAISLVEQLLDRVSVCDLCLRVTGDGERWEEVIWPVSDSKRVNHPRTVCHDCFEAEVRPEVDLVYRLLRSPGRRTGHDRAMSVPIKLVRS